ncbi:MAG: gephyrin-like molybdotransferase Glp [Bryobacteraceae bacterium]
MADVTPLRFAEARECVLERVRAAAPTPVMEWTPLADAEGRILAQPVLADRDYPPVARSVRDGFAIRAQGFSGSAQVIGEVRAGDRFQGHVAPGEAVEIMTGAPVPDGADAIVMVEYVTRDGPMMHTDRRPPPNEFVNSQGAEAAAGEVLLPAGRRIGFSEIALLATVGLANVPVYRRPEVAILATGDEIVPVEAQPEPHQIRNSNGWSLAAQVRRAGGIPRLLPVARDEHDHTRKLVEEGLTADLLLLSGGVSAGKYDIVEGVLADAGAEFFFDRVLIQPGQPVVFGSARGRFFFGLPGNPVSTMVTFEIFARTALQLLSGEKDPLLPVTAGRLTRDFRHKPGLTRFLPATLEGAAATVTPVKWQGSSDVTAMARGNCWIVVDAEKAEYKAGEEIGVLLK